MQIESQPSESSHQNPHQGPQAEKIRSMFSQVAQGYDRANNILSAGIHHLWRKKLVAIANVRVGDNVLDCATGTGDLAIAFKKAVGPTGTVVGTDFCEAMLLSAPSKAQALNLDISFEIADVMQLPYESGRFDVTSISFGIRNVQDPLKGLSEMARVTRPGGKVMVLEFGQVQLPVLGPLYRWYSQRVLPRLGGLVTGQKDAYEYLQTSSAAFPCGEEFIRLMASTNRLKDCRFIPLSAGIAYLYEGTVK